MRGATHRFDCALRCYNLEVESKPGEITHNFFVGDYDVGVWVHNINGNSKNSPVPAVFYALYDKAGKFLKWGITANPGSRYPKSWGCQLVELDKGSRVDMLAKERIHTKMRPGPWNHESWAGTGITP